jgi:hypothetical protein
MSRDPNKRMNNIRLLLIAAVLLLPITAAGSPCGTSGMTVVKADSGSHYVLYVFREGPDIAFQLPGKDISFPKGTEGPKTFIIDGVHFETLLAKTTEPVAGAAKLTDVEMLKKHRDREVEYIKTTPSPLTKLVEHGPRERPAGNGQPSFTFYLWQIVNPQDLKGASQYFLTTVSGGEIAVFSAIVPDPSKESVAMQAFQSYAGSFQHILRKEQCPQETKIK